MCVRSRVASCARYVRACARVCPVDTERRGNPCGGELANGGPSSNRRAPIGGQERSRMRATVTTGCTIAAGSGDGLRVRHRLRARAHPRSSLLAFGVGRVARSRVTFSLSLSLSLSLRQFPEAEERARFASLQFTLDGSTESLRLRSVPIQPRSVPPFWEATSETQRRYYRA